MKFAIVFVALFGLALAAPPQSPSQDAVVTRQDAEVGPESYQYNVETSDGKSASEEGHIENLGKEDEAISVKGQFSYIGDDGATYQVTYIADKNGFQPQGAHLPVEPKV
ncbi:larval cuticle protein 65Ag1-like [Episyrphus balteatus]|uniref:larval cuticle protein 65Ag1-like n=1 Tax=Episyrphus balteatus TaxID=286459 RepID=UPI002486B471|nr:larval cuticle protein 65Ag1-like [Episyrphus balteatus]